MILLPFSWSGCEPALGIDRRAPRVVLAILARERIDQALDAVVAGFFGESVAVAHERAGIRAHEKRPEFPNELLALLGAGAPPVGAHRDPGRMREIEVGQDLRLDEARDLFRIAGLDVLVLADRGEYLQRDGSDECVRRQFLRGRTRRGKGEHESRGLESVAHGIKSFRWSIELAPGLLTTLCQEHAFHVGCGDFFLRLPSHQRSGAPIRAPGNNTIAARTSPPLRRVRKKSRMTDPRSSSTGASDGASVLASSRPRFSGGKARPATNASSTYKTFFMLISWRR